MSDSAQPHKWQPTRLRHPWDSPGKITGVGCHFLLQCMKVKRESEVTQSCSTLCDPMDCSLPGSSVHGIFQKRVLEWVAIAFSKKKKKVWHLQPISSVWRYLAFLPVSLSTRFPFLYSSIFGLQYFKKWGLPRWCSGKESTCNAGDTEIQVQFLGQKDPLSRQWQHNPVFLPGKSHWQRSLVGYRPSGHKELDTTEQESSL